MGKRKDASFGEENVKTQKKAKRPKRQRRRPVQSVQSQDESDDVDSDMSIDVSEPKYSPQALRAVPLESPKPTKIKTKKGPKGKESGTSSEEERWLDAIESGKLEEVDDELKKIKPKDPKMMTARQRAMYERGTDKEPGPSGEVLMALPSGYKEKVMTAEAIQKAAIKSQKRKQLADEKREKDKKKTMERLLKKQESKASKGIAKAKPLKKAVPLISYKNSVDRITLSMPPDVEFPLTPRTPIDPPKPIICGISDCVNLKRYSCSRTGVPLCSLECYQKNLANIVS